MCFEERIQSEDHLDLLNFDPNRVTTRRQAQKMGEFYCREQEHDPPAKKKRGRPRKCLEDKENIDPTTVISEVLPIPFVSRPKPVDLD